MLKRLPFLHVLWSRVDEPRVVRLVIAIRYVLGIGLGIAIIGAERTFHDLDFLQWLPATAGAMILAGSSIGVVFAWSRRWDWERIGTILVGGGAILGALVELLILSEGVAEKPGANLILLMFFLIHVGSMVARFVRINKDNFAFFPEEIEQKAEEILQSRTQDNI